MNERPRHDGDVAGAAEFWAFRMLLKEGQEEAYRKRHDEIWPELKRALCAAGVLDFRIFLDPETRMLFAIMRCRAHHELQTLRESPLMRRWWAMMSDIMETNADLSPREWPLVPMFELDPS
jgi:L-rhamnose mutarotase